MAWRVSNYQGERCNDFSIGIEAGGDGYALVYTDAQYQQLAAVTRTLSLCYPAIADNMTGHCNIAVPDRKTDPGPVLTGRAALGSLFRSNKEHDMTLFTTHYWC